MIYTEQDVEKAVSNLVSKNLAPIARHYDGYIVLAQDEGDFQSKVSKIQRGNTFGFYTVERALSLNGVQRWVYEIDLSEEKVKSFLGSFKINDL